MNSFLEKIDRYIVLFVNLLINLLIQARDVLTKSVITANLQKENKMASTFFTPSELREKFLNPDFREEVALWVENNLRPLEDDKVYLDLVQKPNFVLTGKIVNQIDAITAPFLDLGSRGHGKGHHKRDWAHAYALAIDSFKNPKVYPNEAIAGLIGGISHEIAAGVMIRYHDKKYAIGHAEAGSWMLYQLLKSIIPDQVLLPACYSIARHTTYTTDFTSEDGHLRKVWKDSVFEANGKLVRIAVWLTAMADRLDNLGASHFCRTIDATADGTVFGGANLRPDGGWDNLDEKYLRNLLIPNFWTVDGKPSTFYHLLGYGASAVAKPAVYNAYDHVFPVMRQLVAKKHAEIILICNSLNNSSNVDPGIESLLTLLDRVEMEVCNGQHQSLIGSAWSSLSDTERAKWGPIISIANRCYTEWVEELKDIVIGNPIFPDFDNTEFFSKLG